MDREYYLASFAIAVVIATLVARVAVSRIGGWALLREANDDPRTKLFTVAAVSLLLWVSFSFLAQVVSGLSVGVSQWFLDVDNFPEPTNRRIRSISSGVATGVHTGFALGLVEYAFRALMQVRRMSAVGVTSGIVEEDWSRPTED